MTTDTTPLDLLTAIFTSLQDEEVYLVPADNPELKYATASLTEAARFIEEEKSRGVYISTGTFTPGTARQQKHLLCVPVIVLDADLKDALEHGGMADAEAKVRTCNATVLAKLRKTHVRLITDTLARVGIETPSVLAFTGGGHHVHLLLDYLDQRSIARIRDVHKALVSALNTLAGFPLFDPQVIDSGTRFMRVPGTANCKCSPPRWAEIVANSGPTFTLEQLEQAAGIHAEQAQEEPKQGQEDTQTHGDDLAAIVTLLAPYWTKGKRHELALSLSGYLAKGGWLWEQAEALFVAIASQADDEELRSRLGDLRGTYDRLAKDEKVKGYTALSRILVADDLHQLETLAGIGEIPIIDESTDDWPVLHEDALHGLPGKIVNAIDPHTEGDKVATLLNTLVAFGNCLNIDAHIRVQHDNHPARLDTLLVGKTSKGRKGTSWSTPKKLFSMVEKDWAKKRTKSGLSSAEGLIYNVRDPLWQKQPIKEKGKVIDYQDVCVDAGETDKRLLIIEPEFASTLTVMGREGNNLSAVIRQAWDDGNLSPLTKNNPLTATDAHISIIGHITQDELLARLDDTSKANGFCNRFLFALVRRSKELPEGGSVPDDQFNALVKQLTEVLTFARTIKEVKRDGPAKKLWAELYHDLSNEKPGMLGAITSRAEAQVLRLSLIYALFDCSSVIRVEHLKAALALWRYCEQSAAIIFGKRLGDPTADRILEAIRTSQTGLSDTDIYELFGRNKSANERTRALLLLQRLGLVAATQEQTGGRPRKLWRATC
jgi:hypothetical protein